MYVVVQHQIRDPQTAFSRGEKLIKNDGAPSWARRLQFYPSTDGSAVTCRWEAESVEEIQQYVDSTLGDSSVNTCYEVDPEQAFAERPLGLPGVGRDRRVGRVRRRRVRARGGPRSE
jgi:hypothetical protein